MWVKSLLPVVLGSACPGADVIKLVFPSSPTRLQKARVFVPGRFLRAILVCASKAGAYGSEHPTMLYFKVRFLALLANNRLTCKKACQGQTL